MKKQLWRRAGVFTMSSLLAMSSLTFGTVPVNAASTNGKYYTDFATFEEEQAAAEKLAAEIGSEGIVLLKNQNNSLPLDETVKNITLFGGGAYDTVYGGGGSGAGSVNEHQTQQTIVGSLENAGFTVNPTVEKFYENLENLNQSASDSMWASASTVRYADLVNNPNAMDSVKGSYTYYNDAAIIVFSREGSEGSDKSTTTFDNGRTGADYAGTEYEGVDSHSLELFPEELELIKHVEAQNFGKIIVLLNTSNAMETAVLEDDENIDGIFWIGNPGGQGLTNLGDILRGDVNPSGRMVDVYDADHTQDPTWYNFGDLTQTGDNSGEGSIYYKDENGEVTELAGVANAFGSSPRQQIEYEEGIYVGYKWYETAATIDGYYTADDNSYAPGTDRTTAQPDAYYNRTNGVVYPFGYGLSYTTFSWEITGSNADKTLDAKTTVQLKVRVTNTGDRAGKDVVEVYYTPQYYNGGIEKSAVNLIDYAKTDLLQPGESQVLTISFNAKDMASFDYNDANANGFTGYELEAGTYEISLRSDSHTVKDGCTLTYTVEQGKPAAEKGSTGILYDGSSAKLNWNEEGEEDTGKANAEALFSDPDSYYYSAAPKGDSASNVQYVTRADWKLPTAPTVETSILTQEDIDNILYQENFTPADDKETDPWYVADDGIPETWTQATQAADADNTIKIQTLLGKDYDVKIVDGQVVQGDDEDTKAWETFMNQFTLDELKNYLSLDWELASIDRAGIDKLESNDGPAKLLNGTYWPSCSLIASTWNTDLAYQQGRMTGNEGLFQNCLGWYGPGANIHRSPFGGRNFEYYSSDGIQGGMICAAVIKGATDMGIMPTLKHCALNDQETHRQDNQGLVVWCNEQAMREIYFKPFEMAVTDGNNVAFMSSYTRYGAVGADNNYMFQNVVVRDEWGMDGMFYSDMGGADNADYHFRTGGTHGINSYTNQISGDWNADGGYVEVDSTKSNTQYAAIRLTAMNWMHTALNRASNRNMVNTSAFTDKSGTTVNVIKGQAFEQDLGASLEDLNAYEMTYAITEGTLPEGLSLDSTGKLSGTATETGEFPITVTLTADRYVTTVSRVNTRSDASQGTYSTDATFTISVQPAFTFSDTTWTVGTESETQISSDVVTVGDDIASITYELKDAPEWLHVSEDGAIYGTPEEAGTYTVNVDITATQTQSEESQDSFASIFGNQEPASTVYHEEYTLTAEDPTDAQAQNTAAVSTGSDGSAAGTQTNAAASSSSATGIIGIIVGAVGCVLAFAAIAMGRKKNK